MLNNIDVSELNLKVINNILESTKDVVIAFLKRKEIKELIIKDYSFYDLFHFYCDRNKDYFSALFDSDEAISYLNDAKNAKEKISILLRSDLKDELLANELFVSLVLTKFDYIDLASIRDKSVTKRLLFDNKYYQYLDIKRRTSLLLNLSNQEIINTINNEDINIFDLDILLENPTVFNWIVKNKKIYLSNLPLYSLVYYIENNRLDLPQFLIDDIDFIYLISNSTNILLTRRIINGLNERGLDTSKIEKKKKQFYNNLFNNIKQDMISIYYDFYQDLFLNNNYSIEFFDKLYEKYFYINDDFDLNPNGYLDFNEILFYKVRSIYIDNKIDIDNKKKKIKNLLIKISVKYANNIFIDYHFEEFYYNVLMDISELLNFHITNKTNLNKENYELYKKILSFDYSNINNIIKIHNNIKNKNIIEMFYDDMKDARDLMNESIANSIINKKELEKFRNDEKSNQFGVDIYEFNGEEFFALVKVGERTDHKNAFGHSFSLIGKNAIGTFKYPFFENNYIYEGLKPEQIVHVFPFDSFTEYNRNKPSSKNVRVLMNPNDLLNNSGDYNELLVLEKGTNKTEFDEYIPLLKQIALYCYDEITSDDIENAKDKGIGIMLVNTKNYKFGSKKHIKGEIFDKYEYYDGTNVKTLESIRKDITKM